MSTIDARRNEPDRSARSQLIDLHFEVRNAIAELLAEPTVATRVTLQRAIHRFLAAERALAGRGDLGAQLDVAERRARLIDHLEVLDAARERTALFQAPESLRRTFLELCHPLWRGQGPAAGRPET